MAATDFFVGLKTQEIKVRNNLNFTITLPTIWECADYFTEIYNGHHK